MAFPDKKPKLHVMIGLGGKPGADEPDGDEEASIEAPEGMDLEGKKSGDMIEAVTTYEIMPDNKLCARKVNGMPVPGYDDADKPDDAGAPPDDDSFTSAAMGAPPAGGDQEEET